MKKSDNSGGVVLGVIGALALWYFTTRSPKKKREGSADMPFQFAFYKTGTAEDPKMGLAVNRTDGIENNWDLLEIPFDSTGSSALNYPDYSLELVRSGENFTLNIYTAAGVKVDSLSINQEAEII